MAAEAQKDITETPQSTEAPPSEQITPEAKAAEPDAEDVNKKMEDKGMDNLPTIT